jgi:predicted small integral membrane protein
MANISTSTIIRITKIALIFTIACFTFIVALDNIIDYNSNFQFVKHVLSMDTTFRHNHLLRRAITSPIFHHIAYNFIICLEGLITILCFKGGYDLLKHIKAPAHQFHEAKKFFILGSLCCCLLWFFGFQVVGGEWFGMWMSTEWNGLMSAFRLVTYMFLTLLFVSMKNDD